jgi:hypothetical protein
LRVPGSSVLEQYLDGLQPAEASAGTFWLFLGLDPPETKFTDGIGVPKARAKVRTPTMSRAGLAPG